MPVENVLLNLMARVYGQKEVKELELGLGSIESQQRKMQMLRSMTIASMEHEVQELQKKIEIQRIIMEDETGALPVMAQKQAILEALARAHEKEVNALKQKYVLQISTGELETDELTRKGALLLLEDQANQKRWESARVMQIRRREILATTMAMFGLTMSMWQATNAMSALAGEDEEARKEIMRMQALLMGATAPMMIFMGATQLMTMATTKLGLAMRALVPAMLTVTFAYLALTTKNEKLRAIYSVMTGITAALTTASLILSAAKWKETAATVAATTAKMAEKEVETLGMATPALIAGIALAVGLGATLLTFVASQYASAQTQLGQFRYVAKGGVANLHTGERISRPMEDWGGDQNSWNKIVLMLNNDVVEYSVANQTEHLVYLGV